MPCDIICPVLKNERIADDIMLLWLDVDAGKKDEYQPGRFVHMKIPNRPDLILRRPISINGYDNVVGRLELVYQVKGQGTEQLVDCQPGDTIALIGPLGKGYPVPRGTKRALLVGGGIGCAPLKMLPACHPDIQFDAILGFRNRDCIYQLEDFQTLCEDVILMTDDGSAGEKGFVTDALQRYLQSDNRTDVLYVCGPPPMYKALKPILDTVDKPIYISLEERMGCGMGACVVCTCKIKRDGVVENRRVCVEGPVFPYEEVVL